MIGWVIAAAALLANDVASVDLGTRQVAFLSGEAAETYILSETEFASFNDQLDLSLRMEEDLSDLTPSEVRSRAESHFAAQILDWTAQERRWAGDMLENVHQRVDDQFGSCLVPEKTYLLKTTGAENFTAFYTIGEAIVYPQTNFRFVRLPPRRAELEATLAHEYWHVISRNDEALREEAYAVFGFEKLEGLRLPQSILDRRIHNPDVRETPYVLTLGEGKNAEQLVLILVSKYPTYDGKKGVLGQINAAMGYINVQAFPVGPDGVVRDEPREIDDAIVARIGDISSYRFGADEIVAEAFEVLVTAEETSRPKRDQDLLAELRTVLTCE